MPSSHSLLCLHALVTASVSSGANPNVSTIKAGRAMVLLSTLYQAYSVVPVHADNHPLLGIQWQDSTFVDTALPFGLRSVLKIFSASFNVLALCCMLEEWYGNCITLVIYPSWASRLPGSSTSCAQSTAGHVQSVRGASGNTKH